MGRVEIFKNKWKQLQCLRKTNTFWTPFFFFVIKMDFRRDLLFLSADTEVTSVKKRNWEAISKQVNKRELLAYKPSNIKLLRSAGTL